MQSDRTFRLFIIAVSAIALVLAVARHDYAAGSLFSAMIVMLSLSLSRVAVFKICRATERTLLVLEQQLEAVRESVALCEFCGQNRYHRRPETCCMRRALEDGIYEGKIIVRVCPTCGLKMSYFDSAADENCPRCHRPFPVGVPRA